MGFLAVLWRTHSWRRDPGRQAPAASLGVRLHFSALAPSAVRSMQPATAVLLRQTIARSISQLTIRPSSESCLFAEELQCNRRAVCFVRSLLGLEQLLCIFLRADLYLWPFQSDILLYCFGPRRLISSPTTVTLQALSFLQLISSQLYNSMALDSIWPLETEEAE